MSCFLVCRLWVSWDRRRVSGRQSTVFGWGSPMGDSIRWISCKTFSVLTIPLFYSSHQRSLPPIPLLMLPSYLKTPPIFTGQRTFTSSSSHTRNLSRRVLNDKSSSRLDTSTRLREKSSVVYDDHKRRSTTQRHFYFSLLCLYFYVSVILHSKVLLLNEPPPVYCQM